MKRALSIAFVLLALAACRVRYAYNGEPRESHHGVTRFSEPRTRFLPASGITYTSVARAAPREGDIRRVEVTIENLTPNSVRYVHVREFFDHRGMLVRRHTFGPLDIEATTERTFNDEFRLEPSERRFISRETEFMQVLNDGRKADARAPRPPSTTSRGWRDIGPARAARFRWKRSGSRRAAV